MNKFDKDGLYLLVDFLEEQLEMYSRFQQVGSEYYAIEHDKKMYKLAIEVIKNLIKE